MKVMPVSNIVNLALKRRYFNLQYIEESAKRRSQETAERIRAINEFQGKFINIVI